MSRFLLLTLVAAALASLLSACANSESMFNTGRDARVFNPATGRYDWPDENR